MRSALRTVFAVMAAGFVLAPSQVRALEVFGNMTQSPPLDNVGLNVFWPNAGEAYLRLAQGFTFTGGTQSIAAVRIGMNVNTEFLDENNKIVVSLYGSTTDIGGFQRPDLDNLVGNFNADSPSPAYSNGSNTVYTFDYAGASGTEVLNPDVNYWVLATISPYLQGQGGDFRWLFATPASGSPQENTPGALNGSTFSYVGTAGIVSSAPTTWINYSSSGGSPIYSGLSIGIVVVPEPSTYALGAVGVLVMGAIARRKTHKTGKV